MSKVVFNSKYNSKNCIQNNVILLNNGEEFILQKRVNLMVLHEKKFDNANKAYNEFDKVVL